MSSFRNLRASRQSKELKSYVTPRNVPQSSSDTPPLQPSTEGKITWDKSIYSLPPHVDVRISESRGRGLWSKAVCKSGDVLLVVKPHIAVLSNQYLSMHCSNCFGPSLSGLKRCTTCRIVSYCDAQCQNSDWLLHKQECAALQAWSKAAPSPDLALPSDAVRCLGRLIWGRQKRGLDGVWSKQIDRLQSHRESLQPSSVETHAHLSQALVRYLGASSPQDLGHFGIHSIKNLVDITSRFISNTFSVTTPTLTPIGVSVSPLVALINHSCDPNAVVVFPGISDVPSTQEPSMHVIVLRAIEPDEEILISYIDTTLPKHLRQKSLLETYNFNCCCHLCEQVLEVDPRESVFCPKKCGGTCPVPTEESDLCRCTKCGAIVKNTDAILDALRIGEEALNKATTLQFKDPGKAKQLTTNLIPILTSAGVIPSSYPLLALVRLHECLLVDSLPSPPNQESLDDAIRAATRANAGLSSVYPKGHPVRGLALAELGKLLAVDEPSPNRSATPAEAALLYPPSGPPRLKLAYETLQKARNELLIGFGSKNDGGEVGKDVRKYIITLEKEIGIWKQGVKNALLSTT